MSEPTIHFHAGGGAPAPEAIPDDCVLVIFGGAGDLARRKLIPALYHLQLQGALPEGFAVCGLGRTPRSDEDFRALLRESTEQFSRTDSLDAQAWDRLAGCLHYLDADLNQAETYPRLKSWLERIHGEHGDSQSRLFYFAVGPSHYAPILEGLRSSGLLHPPSDDPAAPWSRVVIEKPFGRDLASARELNDQLGAFLDERQVFRIDHYLGKETVQNILVFRFGNSIFEPLWNRRHVTHVEVTAAEALGVETRGSFYDNTGVVRDMLQNHLLQVLTLCAMEPPVSFAAEEIREEKSQVLRALRPLDGVGDGVILGQYQGYTAERDVAADSRTPTYVAAEVFIDNWRWQGVPFYLRTGKRLAARMTEVAVHFEPIPFCLFGRDDVCARVEPNVLTLRLQPDEGITLRFACKAPGADTTPRSVTMDFSYAGAFETPVGEAYERLLLDALKGDATRFARRDAVELSWKFVAPLLQDAGGDGPHLYEPGSDGPAAARGLPRRHGHMWRSLR